MGILHNQVQEGQRTCDLPVEASIPSKTSAMKPFLTARWLNLINISYAVSPELLIPYLPAGVEPDVVDGKAFVSLVPFQFEDVSLGGWPIPFHGSFPEMNLRCYVHAGVCSGVVFIREFVPRVMVTIIANTFYNEHYETAGLRVNIVTDEKEISVGYEMEKGGLKHRVCARAFNKVYLPSEGGLEYFFENRFCGFSENCKGVTSRFRVEHPPWKLYRLYDYKVEVDFAALFGNPWSILNIQDPVCAMLIEGSEVKMMPYKKLVSGYYKKQHSLKSSAHISTH
jgi:uncharacterized protein YqjF (DUF2071 family)